MELNEQQKKGLDIAVKRYRDKKPYTILAGPAGTGKTFTVKYIIKELGLDPEKDVAYCAYTGRAAQVLRNHGNPGAMTTHKLLYKSREMPNGTYMHTPRKTLEQDYKLIVCDEISMLPKSFWDLMLTHGVHVIGLGDPEQLPPVVDDKKDVQHLLDHPHILLTEIMRQSEDSEIIDLSMRVRHGEPLKYFKGRDVSVVPKKSIGWHTMLSADIILCGTNKTRRELNEIYRMKYWGNDVPNHPIEGDKIICLKNNYDYCDNDNNPLINGGLGTISNIQLRDTKLFKPKMIANFNSFESGIFKQIPMDYNLFLNGETTINKDNWYEFKRAQKPCWFDYGNVITVHKSQGSEFDKVILCLESFPFDPETRRRFIYTAITRARKKLIIMM